MKIFLACALVALATACGDSQNEHKLVPLEAPVNAAASTDTSPKVAELEKPAPMTPTPSAPAATPAAKTAEVGAIGAVDVEAAMRDIGPISVISNDEAKKKADSMISTQNAESELQRLKDELGIGG